MASKNNLDITSGDGNVSIPSLKGMYETYFLDYASYVILERAVPSIEDGLKPVQRRILHAMKEMDDGRFHKVANIIGQTMQYHPHGDAAIGDALVKLGQHDLLIDTQGNWGDVRTGDSAAAARYIEARLTKFALDVAFNKDTTEWQLSYDGRKQEPLNLPMKFPLLLAQGVEGIAVGLSTKIMPHNIGELIKASIKILEDKKFTVYPDFDTGGSIDVTEYNNGKRGGKLLIRAKIEKKDKNTLVITELPHSVTTGSLIDSIVKASDKGKIKIKKIVDNTAQDVEVLIDLMPGVSPDLTIDALYAFTSCSISVSPNACVIVDNKPLFLAVNDILHLSTEHSKDLLRQELEIKKADLEQKWHNASLEKIFIEKRVYHEIEECESWEAVIQTIDFEMRRYVADPQEKLHSGDQRIRLMRPFVEEDILRLTEIKIKRISKFNTFKADEHISQVEDEIAQTVYHLEHLTDFAIKYFEDLYLKYGNKHPRKTEITSFEQIDVVQVAANNVKLYANVKEGFMGWGLKKDLEIRECSDIDDIIAFKKDGTFKVSKIGEKVFMGENILHVDVWKKGDDRTTYNLIYLDGESGRAMGKRFNVTAITRDKDYDLTKGTKGSKVLYFTNNPNGESEIVRIQLSPSSRAKIKVLEFDFDHLDIKGRGSQGNIVTRYPIRKIEQLEVGQSTLGAVKLWVDEVSGRVNTDERGIFLGAFDTGDLIIALYADGTYILHAPDPILKVDTNQLLHVSKLEEDSIVTAVHYDGEKDWTMIKRFKIETSTLNEKAYFIREHNKSKLLYATTKPGVELEYYLMIKNQKELWTINLDEFIEVKGWKAMGNRLCTKAIRGIRELQEAPQEGIEPSPKTPDTNNLKPGDTIELDL
ncbi:MAG: DNA gyrase/topoisomerase IV subunit A [Saprospiraceae bacterium]|nr:DNA gyrase/topoisomerase IV subunit A [Saprospiraceae bacterium]